MTHTTNSQRATTRGRPALVRTDALRPIGNSLAGRGVEIRCRAFATGGDR
jgi:hypothetical protein